MKELILKKSKTEEEASLLQILRIAHDVSMRGAGISITEALHRSNYRRIRSSLRACVLLPLLDENPDLVEAWLSFSEDKRTTGGWYLLRTGEIGRVTPHEVLPRRQSLSEAIADYALLELDFWASNLRGVNDST